MLVRWAVALCASVGCLLTNVAEAGPFSLAGDARWIALASRRDIDEAIGVARAYQWRFKNVRVMQATNGWYAVVFGPERVPNLRAFKDNLLNTGRVPPDLLFSKGDAYVAEVWKPTSVASVGEVKLDGRQPATLRVGDLAVTVTAEPKGDSEYVPTARGYQSGKLVFRMRLEENSLSEPRAEVTAIRLDPTAQHPQIVFTAFWGGAHCCTMTDVATFTGGAWRVIQGKTLDGGGYGFEDIDQDGAYELINADNSFLYAFAPYAGSYAPTRVSQVIGDRIVDVTREPKFQSNNRQQLYRMEHQASLDPDGWRSNGFLAAWVATKALVGEFDEAWGRMLGLYDRSSDWPLTECTVERVQGACPSGKERKLDFPTALRKHLEEEGYIPRRAAPPASENVAIVRPAPIPPKSSPTESKSSSGTGFFVTGDGHLVTNNHVVNECSSIDVKEASGSTYAAQVLAQDKTNDLALLKVDHPTPKFASLRVGVRLGEPIAAFGFPFASVLSSSGNFTLGNITALAGIGDDTRYLQISAPVQPGNSGGPLLDESGNVVGVVTAKLNALKVVVATGDLPQNINFAIKASGVAAFLESNRVELNSGTSSTRMSAPDLADLANAVSVLVRCQ